MEPRLAVPARDENGGSSRDAAYLLKSAAQPVAEVEMLSELDNLRHELEGVRRQLEQARAAAAQLEEKLADRDRRLADIDSHQAYRFAGLLLEVRTNPRLAWKLPFAFAKLAIPWAVRHFVRVHIIGPCKALLARARALDHRTNRAAAELEVWPPAVVRNTPLPADQPLISVVIPCFNYGRFLDEALASLYAQTLQDFEIIIVEGGSTDGLSPQHVQGVSHPKVRTLFQPTPTKVSQNRLDGLRMARGKYVVFLDADDVLAPTYLEKAVLALELLGVDLAYPSVQQFGQASALWEPAPEFTLTELSRFNTIPTVAMFRKDAWKELEIGYSLTARIEDFDFWLRWAVRGARGHKIREPLMLYRVHGQSITDELRPKYPTHLEKTIAPHRSMLGAKRVALVSARQRTLPKLEDPHAALVRIERQSDAQLRMALALPWMVVGGSDRLLVQLFADAGVRSAKVLAYTTLEAPASMGSSRRDYERITDDVFDLPAVLPPRAHAEAVMHLLRSRRIDTLMIVGSALTYDLLPRIRRELPDVKVVDHLYNPVGHFANNRKNARYIDFHIAANDEVAQALVAAGELDERVRIIPHGIDMREVPLSTPYQTAGFPKLQLRAGDRLVLFAGRFSQEKGVLRFVDLVHHMRGDPRLVFAMIGDGPLRAEVEHRIRERGVGAAVHLLGLVDDPRPYLRRADVVVIPSDIEGLPLVALEALALGTPVVASRLGALPTAIEDGVTGALADPKDLESYAAGIRRALQLDSDRERLARRCRASVVDRFSIETVRDQYYEVFRSLRSART